MSGLTKKTAKPKTRKLVKRASVAAQVPETPVLFRLPDLTLSPEPSANNSQLEFGTDAILIGVTAPSNDSVAVSPRSEKAKGHKPRELAPKSLLFVRHFIAPAARRAALTAGRVALMPYVAPAGLLCASLLVTLGVIYNPFGEVKQTAATSNQDQASPTSQTKSNVTSAQTSKSASPSSRESLQLKKIANQLDEQLLAQDSADESATPARDESDSVGVAAATGSAFPPTDDELDTGSFTEPWSRKKPSPQVEVARAEMKSEEIREESDEEGGRVVHGDLEEEYVPPKRTAQRTRASKASLEEEGDLEMEGPKKRRPSRFAEEDRPEETDEPRYSSNPENNLEEADVDVPLSPWRRIRNERLEREPNREELIGKTEAPKARGKAQYRSPQGQDIDLDEEWFAETASRPRGETKRTGPR